MIVRVFGLLPVSSFLGWERSTPGTVQGLQAGEVDLQYLPGDVEFVRTVVIVEPDDGFSSAGFTVVERVLDSVRESFGFGNVKDADPSDGAVVVGLYLVFQHCDVIANR
jgi:hypothetical protein